jgi:hypothetical protein
VVGLEDRYLEGFQRLTDDLLLLRERYVQAAVVAAVGSAEFRRELDMAQAQARGEGKPEEEIEALVRKLEDKNRTETRGQAAQHLAASLGKNETKEQLIERFGAA